MIYALFYNFVENFVERRPPVRDEHLSLVYSYTDRDEILAAGSLGIPPTDGLILFSCAESVVKDFISKDPFVRCGLVTSYSIEPWNIVSSNAKILKDFRLKL